MKTFLREIVLILILLFAAILFTFATSMIIDITEGSTLSIILLIGKKIVAFAAIYIAFKIGTYALKRLKF